MQIVPKPMTSLNPVYTIGDQIMEAIQLHQKLDKVAARTKLIADDPTTALQSQNKGITSEGCATSVEGSVVQSFPNATVSSGRNRVQVVRSTL